LDLCRLEKVDLILIEISMLAEPAYSGAQLSAASRASVPPLAAAAR